MIKLIIGNKGSGKTKKLLSLLILVLKIRMATLFALKSLRNSHMIYLQKQDCLKPKHTALTVAKHFMASSQAFVQAIMM